MRKIKSKADNTKNTTIIILAFIIGFSFATASFVLIGLPAINGDSSANIFSPQVKCDYSKTPCLIKEDIGYNRTIATDIGRAKVKFLEELVQKPIIQNAVKESNQKDLEMDSDIRNQIYVQREKTWTTSLNPTPFMLSISQNNVADFLRKNLRDPSGESEDIVFGEHILTNILGPNVAVSIITDNYLQSNDDWWQQAINNPEDLPFARECEFDSSAQMFSEDLVIGIFDESGKLIGIMNSATPCNVTQQSIEEDKSIKNVREEDLSELGKFKIFVLQKLAQDRAMQEFLKSSNREYANFSEEDLLDLKTKQSWPNPEHEPNELQLSIINNDISKFLRKNVKVESEEFELLEFPEMILTNSKGITVASTNRTYSYVQFFDEWWIKAAEEGVLVRQCGYDSSINTSSEDIIIKIFDEKDNFIGILNSASPCDVIKNKDKDFFGDSN